jgi:hypothetical protein
MFEVAIPSYGRAGAVKALPLFPYAVLYVPASQEADYRAVYPDANYHIVPDDQDGSAAKKRNYILTHSPCQDVLMVDDDVTSMGYWECGVYHRMLVGEIYDLVGQGFRMAREAKAPMWGINLLMDKRAYSVLRPFSLISPILGTFCGHCLPHGLLYDDSMGAKEDYDMFLQAIRKYRRCFRFNKYNFTKDRDTKGGWYSQRTNERELEWAKRCEEKWGKLVNWKKNKNLLNGRVNIPIPGC